jgi:hypothetical protein
LFSTDIKSKCTGLKLHWILQAILTS